MALELAHRAEPLLRARIVEGLEDHFHARVELDSFHMTLRGGLWAEGKGLRIWPPAQVAGVGVPRPPGPVKPLIQLTEFRFHAPLDYRPGEAIKVSVVHLEGLEVDLPPRSILSTVRRALPAKKAQTPDFCASRWRTWNAKGRT